MRNGRIIPSSDTLEKVRNGSETLGDGIKKPISEQNGKPLSAAAKSRRSRRNISSCPRPVIEQDPTTDTWSATGRWKASGAQKTLDRATI
jgi:hypothetical protein